MSLIELIKRLFRANQKQSQGEERFDPELFVYVKIPESIGPINRGAKYEDPIDDRLACENLGTVSGGGSQLGDLNPDGTRFIESCGLDIDVSDLPRALSLLRAELPKLGAPEGTELHYTEGGVRLQDVLVSGTWNLRQPRAFLHPGFGC